MYEVGNRRTFILNHKSVKKYNYSNRAYASLYIINSCFYSLIGKGWLDNQDFRNQSTDGPRYMKTDTVIQYDINNNMIHDIAIDIGGTK